MTKYTEEQIVTAAELSCFYVTPDGLRLRINACFEGNLHVLNEDTGDEHEIPLSDIAEEDDPHFEVLTRHVFA